MARYRGTVQGQRGVASRLGGTGSGLTVRADGWNVGARVRIAPCAVCGEDRVSVERTGGSNSGAFGREVAAWHVDGTDEACVTRQKQPGGVLARQCTVRDGDAHECLAVHSEADAR